MRGKEGTERVMKNKKISGGREEKRQANEWKRNDDDVDVREIPVCVS